MKISLVAILALVIMNVIIDIFIYRELKKTNKEWLKKVHVIFSTILYFCLGYIYYTSDRRVTNNDMVTLTWMLFTHLSIYVPKYIYTGIEIISLVPKLWKAKQWKWLSKTASIVSFGLLFIFWWSALVTPRNFVINEVAIESEKIPEAFDGYTIVQFSDLHSGTYGKRTGIMENMVEEINGLHPDLIAFTGDIVNRNSKELLPFIETLRKLEAKDGVVSILGNHDYGDYMRWRQPKDKKRNFAQMIAIQRDSLGWKLLKNQSMFLHQGADSIMFIGTENYMKKSKVNYCRLDKSYPKDNTAFKILLSHNPEHWEDEVVNKTDIDLTLAGHTHAMQSMIKIGNKQFSPSSMRYKHWAGLTLENGQYLYVNVGIGEVGVPVRIGANPEITLLTLKKKK